MENSEPVSSNASQPMKILVTGAAGFLGSHLVDFLLNQGHEVIGLDSFQTGSPRHLKHLENNLRFKLINWNVQDELPDPPKVDQIYHLACPASPIQYQKNHVSTLATCYRGTENMLKLAKLLNARVLLSSTSEVYGDAMVSPQPETYWGNVNPFGPRSCYDEGKRVAEALCYAYKEQYAVDVRIARIFNTYGPRMSASDGRVISNFVAAALDGQDLRITGDGTATRSFQYVSDCTRGLYALMNSGYGQGPVNIGNDTEYHTILKLAEIVADVVPRVTGQSKLRSKITFHPKPVDDPVKRRPQITLAREALGWSPVVSLEEGLRETIRWHIDEMIQQHVDERKALTDSK
ncbi:hypothetical protein VTN00DRAFT_8165 [Thermoascus crustaceus]|uniref:uncharacterized protein n=1 Tax=Thermoascus crustaceus TaxID=5088 RepID=UPI003743631E